MQPEVGDRIPVPAADWSPAPMDGRDRRHAIPWEWWDALVIYVLWLVVAGAGATIVGSTFSDPLSSESTAVGVLVAVVMLTAVTVSWVRFRGLQAKVPDAVRRAFGVKQPTLRDVALGIGYGLAGFVVVQLGLGIALTTLIDALGRDAPVVQEGVQEAAQAGGVTSLLVGLGVVLLGPLGEELLYRGVLFQALNKHLPAWPAIGLSGLAFGVTHVEGFVIALTFPLGMVLAWVMRRHGTLVVPIVAHVVFNLIGFLLIRSGAAGVG